MFGTTLPMFRIKRNHWYRVDPPAGSFVLGIYSSHLSVLLFSKLNEIFFGYFDPENIFIDNEYK